MCYRFLLFDSDCELYQRCGDSMLRLLAHHLCGLTSGQKPSTLSECVCCHGCDLDAGKFETWVWQGIQGRVLTFCQLGFIIPLGAKPKPCYNDITPNDMYSETTCAFSGACLLAGGWCTVMWGMIDPHRFWFKTVTLTSVQCLCERFRYIYRSAGKSFREESSSSVLR